MKFSDFLRRLRALRPNRPQPRRDRFRRLSFEVLEDRCVPTTSAGAMISGVAFFGSGSRTAASQVVTGTAIELTGTTTGGAPVSETTTTDAGGFYNFVNLQPGTYNLTSSQLAGNTLGPIALTDGQIDNLDLAFTSIVNTEISLRLLLASGGLPYGNVANNQPFVLNPIQNVTTTGASPTVINLAGNFGEADMTDPVVTFTLAIPGDTNAPTETYRVELFGKIAPQTVANFLSYVESATYSNTLIHRVQSSTSPNTDTLNIIQGGSFTFTDSSPNSTLNSVTTDPNVPGEPDISDTANTIAMALSANPVTQQTDPNSGTSGFFFNTGDNSVALDHQGFTVFGKVLSADQTTFNGNVVPPIAAAEKQEALPGSPATGVPLFNYAPTSGTFPGNTTAANWAFVTSVTVPPNPAALTYSLVSNTNPALFSSITFGDKLTGFDNNLLVLNYSGVAGTAVITVQATNPATGLSVTTSFTVTVT